MLLRTTVSPLAMLILLMGVTSGGCGREPRGEPNARVRAVVGTSGSPVLRLPDGDTVQISDAVAALYRERGYRQIWTDYDEVHERGIALLETMGRSSEDGFDPQEYRYDVAVSMIRQVEEDSLAERDEPGRMGEVDLVLSEVFARYAGQLAGGALDPRVAGLDWQIEREQPDVKVLIARLMAGADPQALVDSLRPRAPEYRLMMAALARYREIAAAGGWPVVPATKLPAVGGSSPAVAALRRRLLAERDPIERSLSGDSASGAAVFDDGLKQALTHFRVRHGLPEEGGLDVAALEQLNTRVERRIADLKLNLDRWRWLPRDLGELYVMVNVAGFELEVVENDAVLLHSAVVVGKDAWRTPIFRDTMESIVVNPYWNVPPSIAAEEVLPELRRDPSYLQRNNMEVVVNDRPVGAQGIDWSQVGEGDSPYRFRQRPGGDNALGVVKLLFPNQADVYLHDTPAGHLFDRTARAFSHGCIRVEKAVEMAKLIMAKASAEPPEAFDELKSAGSERWVRLTRPVPVYVLYFTAYAQRDGSVSFHPDVYARDSGLRAQGSPPDRRRLPSFPPRG